MSAASDPPSRLRTVVVSGLSGSGKTTAIRALEDIGFFCIDNLPIVLLEQVRALCERASIARLAVVADVRELAFLAGFDRIIGALREAAASVDVLFLDCRDEVLIRRFKETRRNHPLQRDGTILDGIVAEREALSVVRACAVDVIDTSSFNVHELRRRVQEIVSEQATAPLHVRVESFGFKHGLPHEADYVFDVRFLPNPYFVEELRERSGRDEAVRQWLEGHSDFDGVRDRIATLLDFVLPRIAENGRSSVTVAVGCTGGQHRSVAIAEWLAQHLVSAGHRSATVHRDMKEP